jgi:hypothetical protein
MAGGVVIIIIILRIINIMRIIVIICARILCRIMSIHLKSNITP